MNIHPTVARIPEPVRETAASAAKIYADAQSKRVRRSESSATYFAAFHAAIVFISACGGSAESIARVATGRKLSARSAGGAS